MKIWYSIYAIIITLLVLSCGIPSIIYIESPSVSSTSSSGFTFTVEMDSDGYIDGYKLYARYYANDGEDTEEYFDDIDISETGDDSAEYLEDLGYFPVYIVESSYIASGAYTYDEIIDDDTEEYDLSVLKFAVDSTTTFEVEYTSDDDVPLLLTTGDESYTFLLEYTIDDTTKYLHCPGIYTDDKGEDFYTVFETYENDGETLEKIYLEFALFNVGESLSSDLESLPVYGTVIEITEK